MPLADPHRLTDLLRNWRPAPAVATIVIAATSVGSAFASYFARRLTDGGISPVAVAFFRFAIIAAVLTPLVAWDRPRRGATTWGLASGAAMGLGWIAYVDAIDRGAVATAGVVYMTFPLFTLFAARLVFGIRPSPRSVGAAGLVIVAALVALGAPGTGVPLTALVAPATFGFSIAVLTERLGVLDPFERLGAVALGAMVALVPLVATMEPSEVVPLTLSGWTWLIGIGVGCALLPMLLYAAVAQRVGAAGAAMAGSAELPTVFAIGAVFFGEGISAGQLVAALTIGVAIAMTTVRRSGVGVQSVEMPPSTGTTAPVV
ncbi:MAG TPA: DMT family transporter [Ilumatobacteraceae bacterium]|nr:DMT family transporter [Ilumatobacteraceae bacterium]